MAQRNPMNDRYQTEEHRGKTRRSAASAKPKMQAAGTVHVKSTAKTKEEKKAIRRAQRQKQAELDRKYANPPTPEYQRWRRIWWVCLIGAIVCLAVSFFGGSGEGNPVAIVVLVLSYVLIIAALWIEFSKMKKLRRAYQMQMEARKSKSARAQERREKAAAKAAAAEAEQKQAEEPAEAGKKKGFFGGLFGGKKKADETAESSDEAADKEAAAASKA